MRRALALLTRRFAHVSAPAAAIAFLLLAGCSAREHANPLDPANGQTAGHPAGFVAIALSNQVVLTWSPTPGVSTQLFRKTDADPDFVAITPVMDPLRTAFSDASTINGTTYHYRLFFVTAHGLSGPPATADATPSRVVPWTTDAGQLLRLGADGRAVASAQGPVGEATYLTVDAARDLVWVLSSLDQRVYVVNESIGTRVQLGGFANPQVVVTDRLDGSGWITDYDGGQVWHFLPSGQPGTPPSIDIFSGRPLGIDLDATSRVLWVCDQGSSGRVLQFSTTGTLLGQVVIAAPSRVAVDSANGDAWVTSFGGAKLIHLAADRTVLQTLSLSGPLGVAVDPRRGRIWVTDVIGSQVIAFRRDGTEEFRVRGLPGVRDVAIEPLSGEAWVTLTGTVARVSPTGTLLTTTRGLSDPAGIGLDLVAP